MTISHTGSTLILGGARSGKSAFAERQVIDTGFNRHYIATGRAWDDEMRARIERHREDRGPDWNTVEEPLELVAALELIDAPEQVVLVDCLTLWVTNLMMDDRDMMAAFRSLQSFAAKPKARIIFVSNEVGLGIVPENRMAREFRDHAGRLHQMIAEVADTVYFVAAGLPLKMKG